METKMPKKTKSLTVRNTIEVLGPATPDMNKALERMVERKLAEMMGDKTDGIFEPFFQTQAITSAIKKMETVIQQRKWHYYFEEWGCLICKSKEQGHKTLGMCPPCYSRTQKRLAIILRQAEEKRPATPVRDLQDVARKALKG
jgi:hypothetical protein